MSSLTLPKHVHILDGLSGSGLEHVSREEKSLPPLKMFFASHTEAQETGPREGFRVTGVVMKIPVISRIIMLMSLFCV